MRKLIQLIILNKELITFSALSVCQTVVMRIFSMGSVLRCGHRLLHTDSKLDVLSFENKLWKLWSPTQVHFYWTSNVSLQIFSGTGTLSVTVPACVNQCKTDDAICTCSKKGSKLAAGVLLLPAQLINKWSKTKNKVIYADCKCKSTLYLLVDHVYFLLILLLRHWSLNGKDRKHWVSSA